MGYSGKALGVWSLVLGSFLLETFLHPAAAAPFPATPDAYLSQTPSSSTQLFLINQTAVPYTFSPIGSPGTPVHNSMGFNPVDQFLYAFANSPNQVLRINNDGSIDNLGVPTGWASGFSDFTAAAGTFTSAGEYLMGSGTRIVRIDVTTTPPNVLGSAPVTGLPFGTAFSDWAIHPLTGELFGVAGGTLRKIDPATGATTAVGNNGCPGCGNPGAAWFDAAGNLFVQVNATGDIYQGNTTTGAFQLVANGPTSSSQDAASNPFAPALEKTLAPQTVQVGQGVTYTYKILNPGPAVGSADFSDTLPAGLEYVDGSLSNPFGGSVNAYGGGNTLMIAGLAIPNNSNLAITVQVRATAEGLKQNQAELTFTTAGVPTTVVSDEPGNALKPDPTDLFVEPLPSPAQADLLLTKEVTTALPVNLGETVAYKITVTNQGPDGATGVKLTDLQSGPFNSITNIGGDLSAADCGTPPSSQMGLLCSLPDIPNGGSVVLTYETSVTQEGSWSNLASVVAAEVDPVGGNGFASVFIQTSSPTSTSDTAIEVTPDNDAVDPGEPIEFHGQVVNEGPEDATNVIISNITEGPGTVVDPPQLPAEVGTCSSTDNSFTCLIPVIPAGGSVDFDYSVIPTGPGQVDSLTTVGQGAADPDLDNNEVLVEVAVAVPPTPPGNGSLEGSGNCSLSLRADGRRDAQGVALAFIGLAWFFMRLRRRPQK